ncbi:MAG: hypothetical protein ACI30X_00460 [Muribaculaceae bacterium]
MKKFYSIILCALVANFAIPAFAGSFVFWIDDLSLLYAPQAWSLEEGQHGESNFKDHRDEVSNGYNFITPSASDFSQSFECSVNGATLTTDRNYLYVNGVAQARRYSGSNVFPFTVKENDVVKVFLAGEPTECSVNFSGSGLASAGIIADKVVNVETSSAFACFNGTEMIITPNDGAAIEVGVNDAIIDANAEGKFVFVVNEPTTNVVVNLKGSGITSAINDAADNAEIYNLQGIRVSNDVNTLPAGVYIRGGKKILVR